MYRHTYTLPVTFPLRTHATHTDYLMIFDICILFDRVRLLSHAIASEAQPRVCALALALSHTPLLSLSFYFAAVVQIKWGHFHRWIYISAAASYYLRSNDDSFSILLSLSFNLCMRLSFSVIPLSLLHANTFSFACSFDLPSYKQELKIFLIYVKIASNIKWLKPYEMTRSVWGIFAPHSVNWFQLLKKIMKIYECARVDQLHTRMQSDVVF